MNYLIVSTLFTDFRLNIDRLSICHTRMIERSSRVHRQVSHCARDLTIYRPLYRPFFSNRNLDIEEEARQSLLYDVRARDFSQPLNG